MTVDSIEKRLFDAVDGKHTINDILEKTLTSAEQSHHSSAHTFFQRLWWHDQIVFNASRNKAVNITPRAACSVSKVERVNGRFRA
jgi:hypothetical protein